MSTAFIGYGLVVEYVAPGGDFATPDGTLPQTRGFSGVGPTAEDVDITNDQSPGRAMEYIAGLIDNGQADLEIVVPRGGDDLETILGLNGQNQDWRFTLNDGDGSGLPGPTHGTTLEFPGYIRESPIESRTREATIMRCVIRVAGAITVNKYTPV